MRVKNFKYRDEDAMIIYINEEENNNKEIQDKIKNYKLQCKNISVFIGGNNKIENVLEKIIRDN